MIAERIKIAYLADASPVGLNSKDSGRIHPLSFTMSHNYSIRRFFCCDIRTVACDAKFNKSLLYTNKFKLLDSPIKED